MSHQVQTRQIFDLLDGRLEPKRKCQIEDHLARCKLCAAYHLRVKQILAAAISATEPPDIDWSKIDHAVNQALKTPPKHSYPIQPIVLTMAAAAAVVLALLLPHGASRLPTKQPEVVAESAPDNTVSKDFAAQPLAIAVVTDSLIHPPYLGQILHAGDEIIDGPNDGTRFSINSSSIELFESSHLLVYSLDDQMPTLELKNGRLKATVPPYCFSQGLRVLAGDTSFTMVRGVVEFIFDKENQTLTVSVIDGLLESSDGNPFPGDGIWKTSTSSDQEANDWIQITSLSTTFVDESLKTSTREERIISRPSNGTLPKQVIHQAINQAKPRLRTCYEKALKLDPKLAMSASARVSINPTGSVSSVEMTGLNDHQAMKHCFERAIKELSFPHPEGGSVDFILPLRLSPEP